MVNEKDDAFTKEQREEIEKNRWTQEKIEEAEWKIMENKQKIEYLDKAIAEREKAEVLKEIKKDIKKEVKKEIKKIEREKENGDPQIFSPPPAPEPPDRTNT